MEHWYCVDKEGLATLCANKEDAELTVKECDLLWPKNGPHRVGRVFDETPVQEPVARVSLQWLAEMILLPNGMLNPKYTTPPAAQPAPSQYGSPELQAMIVARAIEKDRAAQPSMRQVGVVEPLMGTMRTVIWDEGMIPSAGTTLWAKDE
jgi:hypothetical protein